MSRTIINIIVDVASAQLFLGMIATGYILRFILPPGSNRAFSLWGLTHHQYGDMHFWISFSLLAVLVIHLMLHWKWPVREPAAPDSRLDEQTGSASIVPSGTAIRRTAFGKISIRSLRKTACHATGRKNSMPAFVLTVARISSGTSATNR
jgi:hypothetical protein